MHRILFLKNTYKIEPASIIRFNKKKEIKKSTYWNFIFNIDKHYELNNDKIGKNRKS